MNLKTTSREVLYQQVWQTPMRDLAKQYGLSDQGLRKHCIRQQIPIPVTGHWAKVQAGKKVKQPPPLPEYSEAKAEARRKKVWESGQEKKAMADAAWTPPVETPSTERARWHPALKELREVVDQCGVRSRQLEKHAKWIEANPKLADRNRHAQSEANLWHLFVNSGLLIKETAHKFLMRVSLTYSARALRILNVILFRAEQEGYTVAIAGNLERVVISHDKGKVLIRISERFREEVLPKEMHLSSFSSREVRHRPTGQLSVMVDHLGYNEAVISDKPGLLIEQNLEKVMRAIEDRHLKSVAQALKLEEYARQRKVSEEHDRQREIERKAQQARIEAENSRRSLLYTEIDNWDRATKIRLYLSYLSEQDRGDVPTSKAFEEWAAWAIGVANELDVSRSRLFMT